MDTDDLNLPSPSNQMLMSPTFNPRHYDTDAYFGQCNRNSSSNSGRSSTPRTDVAATTPSIKPKKGSVGLTKKKKFWLGYGKTSKPREGCNNVLEVVNKLEGGHTVQQCKDKIKT